MHDRGGKGRSNAVHAVQQRLSVLALVGSGPAFFHTFLQGISNGLSRYEAVSRHHQYATYEEKPQGVEVRFLLAGEKIVRQPPGNHQRSQGAK